MSARNAQRNQGNLTRQRHLPSRIHLSHFTCRIFPEMFASVKCTACELTQANMSILDNSRMAQQNLRLFDNWQSYTIISNFSSILIALLNFAQDVAKGMCKVSIWAKRRAFLTWAKRKRGMMSTESIDSNALYVVHETQVAFSIPFIPVMPVAMMWKEAVKIS